MILMIVFSLREFICTIDYVPKIGHDWHDA